MIYRTVLVAAAVAALAVVIALFIAWLGREVVLGSRGAANARPAAPAIALDRPQPLRLTRVMAEGSEPELPLQLPVNLRGITGIGYDRRSESGLLDLAPDGTRANMPGAERLLRRFLATRTPSRLRWFSLSQADAPNVVYIGAQTGSQVYAPLTGTVIAVSDYVIDDAASGQIVQLQPLGDASTMVVLRNIDASAELAVGQTVSESDTLIGTVRDMGDVLKQPLGRYTHDSGTSVEMYVRQVTPIAPAA